MTKDSTNNTEIPNIELVKKYNYSNKILQALSVHDFVDKSTNSKFKVQIIEFADKAKLNSWIKNKVGKSSSNKTINKNIVFIDQYKNYVFWRNGDTKFVQIISIKHKNISRPSLINNFRTEGAGIFPESLIEEYVSQYPSDCSNEGCLSQDEMINKKIKEDLKWFKDSQKDIKNSNYYVASGGRCPTDEKRFKKIQKNRFLTDTELESLKNHCKNKGTYEIEAHKISSELEICGKEIDSYLADDGIYVYDDEETLDECLLRKRFLEEHTEYNSKEIALFINKRNEFILEEIQFLEELEKKMNLKVYQDKIDRSIKEKIERRNEVHGFKQEQGMNNSSKEAKSIGNLNKRSENIRYWFEE